MRPASVPSCRLVASLSDFRELVAATHADGSNVTTASRLSTGFVALDHATGGLPSGGVSLLAGAPAMGVSTLATQIAIRASMVNPDCQVIVFCVSDGAADAVHRHVAGANPSRPARIHRLPKERIWLDDGLALYTAEIIARARQWNDARESAHRLVLVDGLHGLADVELHPQRAHRAVSTLADLAKEVGAAILLCVRLPARSRCATWFPRLSELRWYGQALEHADLVALLYREEYFVSDTDRPGEAEVAIWSRSTERRHAYLRWRRDRLSFEDDSASAAMPPVLYDF